jgi:hydroxymethylpyrimidine pyrophosphatase-like HAD family hydrolase
VRYLVLACDYDETLGTGGRVAAETVAALERLRASGRKLILVTGRELDDVLSIFPQVKLFERIVAENGALVYRPSSREKKLLAKPPPEKFIQALRDKGVAPLGIGNVIVASLQPHETTVLNTIRDLGLEMQVIFNKGAVMVLPAGINKATGLTAALREMCISAHNVVGIGDAENDHAFLNLCECAVAVANALPMLKERADFVTGAPDGRGVAELIDEIVTEDLKGREDRLERHHILLGHRENEEEVRISPYGVNLLLAGPSGSGKSTLTTGVLERLDEQGYQFCVIDPEGDYESFESAVAFGAHQQPPNLDEVIRLLKNPQENAVVNLIGVPIPDRPAFFLALLPRLQELRAQLGHPHWLVLDETHHLLPASWKPAPVALPSEFDRMMFITIEPKSLAPQVLSSVNTVIAVGEAPEKTLAEVCEAIGEAPPAAPAVKLAHGEALIWTKESNTASFKFRIVPSHTERRRHLRKYAEGDLGPDRSFYFQGPDGKLNLQAQNLILFMQLGEGVDDDTWNYHLRRGDYSRWFERVIKDEELAAEAKRVEADEDISADESRALIKNAIEQRYTLPG